MRLGRLTFVMLAALLLSPPAPARAEWPLDFTAPVSTRREPDALVMEADTPFWRYLPSSVKRAGTTYLALEGLESPPVERSAPVPVDRVVLPDGSPVATSGPWFLSLRSATWSPLAWKLEEGMWTEEARLLETSLRIRLRPGAYISSLGMEFAGLEGERLVWEGLDGHLESGSTRPELLDLRVVHSYLPDRTRQVSLWLRGWGVVEIEQPQFVAHLGDQPVLRCGADPLRQLPLPAFMGYEELLGETEGVENARWAGPDALELELGSEAGWQGLSVPLQTPGGGGEGVSLTPSLRVEVVDSEGVERFAVEEYSDRHQRRVGWHEIEATAGQELTISPLPDTDRVGFWTFRKRPIRGSLRLAVQLTSEVLVTDVSLQPDLTICTLSGTTLVPEASRGRFGLRVEADTLARADVNRADAAVAGVVMGTALLGLVAGRRWRKRRRRR